MEILHGRYIKNDEVPAAWKRYEGDNLCSGSDLGEFLKL
jgi:hypothetical protein